MSADETPEVRVLSVKQPWAGLIAAGHKDIENRKWGTDYRGLIAIHSSMQPDTSWTARERMGLYVGEYYDYGAILAIADLVDVTTDHPSNWAEPGLTHWVLDNVHPLPRPFQHRGKLGLTVLDPGTAGYVLGAAGVHA